MEESDDVNLTPRNQILKFLYKIGEVDKLMENWISLLGDFSQEENKIRFIGGYTNTIDKSTQEPINVAKNGILLFKDVFINGTIELDAEFEKIDDADEIQILYNYNDDFNFSCIGLANHLYKYECKNFNGNWNYEKLAGSISPLNAKTIYKIKAEIIGSIITLYINDIKVFSINTKNTLKRTNIGIWARSTSSIIIHNFQAAYDKPKAFVVMQFGKDYDELYYDVIKPICVKKGYDVYRADESMQAGLIINDIIDSIQNSSIIIADITPDNPNVFYEIGFSHALKKPTVLLHEKGKREKLPFDVSGFRTIFYDNTIGGKRDVEQKLEKFIDSINSSLPSSY